MIGIYYVFLVVISVSVYVLSTTFKEKKNKVGSAVCYAILFLIALLFI